MVRKLSATLTRQSLVNKKLVKGRKIRVDSSVVEANISYPTDTDLLYEGEKVNKSSHPHKEAYATVLFG